MCVGKCLHYSLRWFAIAPKSDKPLKTRKKCHVCPIFDDKLMKSTMKSQNDTFSLSPVDRRVFSDCPAKKSFCRVWDFIFQFTSFITENGAKMTIFRVLGFLLLFGALKIHKKGK